MGKENYGHKEEIRFSCELRTLEKRRKNVTKKDDDMSLQGLTVINVDTKTDFT